MVAQMVEEPQGDLSALFSYDDYPGVALRNDETGRVSALVIIDPKGGAKSCKIIVSSSSTALDEATCNIVLRRANIKPGMDSKGRPVEAPTIVNVEWLLP
jgi:protein TonB